MQRTIILMRHAKSNWAIPLQPDHERELNERGNAAAPIMAQRLVQNNISLDLIISSTAIRAMQTAKHVSTITQQNNIMYRAELYHAMPDVINETIYGIDANIKTALIVCHNPGITFWANMQCGIITQNMPTAGLLAITFNTLNWQDYDLAKKEILLHDWPKKATE